jgi:hypothetical protein
LKPGRNARDKPETVDITGWGISAVIKRDAKVIATLEITVLDAALGKYQLYFPDTSGWPVAEMLMDICYRLPSDADGNPGDVYYTPTVLVNCLKTETPRPSV